MDDPFRIALLQHFQDALVRSRNLNEASTGIQLALGWMDADGTEPSPTMVEIAGELCDDLARQQAQGRRHMAELDRWIEFRNERLPQGRN